MDIPLNVVRKGESAINEYIELTDEKGSLSEKSWEEGRNFRKLIKELNILVKNYDREIISTSNPHRDSEGKWVLPDIAKLSLITDQVWTLQKNMETSLSNFIDSTYKYIEAHEKLEKLQ